VLEKRVLYSRVIFLYIGEVFLGLELFAVRLDWVGWEFCGDFLYASLILYIFVLGIFEECGPSFFFGITCVGVEAVVSTGLQHSAAAV